MDGDPVASAATRKDRKRTPLSRDRRLISAAELAADEIRDMIYQGAISPGDRLNPDALAARFSISKTPIRDALQVLKSEGLVEVVPRVGVFVRRMSNEEAADVYRLKAAMEPIATALAAQRGSNGDCAQLTKLLRGLRSAVERRHVAKAEQAVDDIHQQIFNMSRSEVFLEAFRVVNGRVRLLRFLNMAQPGRLEATLSHHTSIVEAIVGRQTETSERLMRDHLLDASLALQNALVSNDGAETSA